VAVIACACLLPGHTERLAIVNNGSFNDVRLVFVNGDVVHATSPSRLHPLDLLPSIVAVDKGRAVAIRELDGIPVTLPDISSVDSGSRRSWHPSDTGDNAISSLGKESNAQSEGAACSGSAAESVLCVPVAIS
jgi:hypothetical protein